MNIKDVVKLHDEIREMSDDEFDTDEAQEKIEEVEDYFDKMSEKGQKILLQRIGEVDLVKLIRTVDIHLMQVLADQGAFPLIEMAFHTGELEPFSQTLVLSMVGILYENEVI